MTQEDREIKELEKFAEYLKREFSQSFAKYSKKGHYNYSCLGVKFGDITKAIHRWKTAKRLNKASLLTPPQ